MVLDFAGHAPCISPCLNTFVANPANDLIAGTSIVLAVAVLLLLRSRKMPLRWRALQVYAHLALLAFPIAFFGVSMGCQSMGGAGCANAGMTELIVYAIPGALLLALLAGAVIMPLMYLFSKRAVEVRGDKLNTFVSREAARAGIRAPKLYAIDDAKPRAFSFAAFSSAIFVSAGALERLNKREAEAVLLHELAHIKNGSSAFKFSSALMRIFSPLASFGRCSIAEEERLADAFAARRQGTKRYLTAAKEKMQW